MDRRVGFPAPRHGLTRHTDSFDRHRGQHLGEHRTTMNNPPANAPRLIGNVSISSLAASLLLAGGVLQAADWPQFRGPLCNGVSDESGVPITLETNKDLAWK